MTDPVPPTGDGEEPPATPTPVPDEGGVTLPPTGGTTPPPVVVPGGDYQQGVDAIYGELNNEVNRPRWSPQADQLAALVTETFNAVLPIAYEMADSPTSREQARSAVAQLLANEFGKTVIGALEAAATEDQ
ncbi:hypothetical protein ACFPC0_10550 [Streptomyces andamanensis]|uniref:Uncharacterized protein n=1 Tax=Streptomyces andamanensis TaxID=1565035 RepID=A0ABV8TCJ8_9ACTN